MGDGKLHQHDLLVALTAIAHAPGDIAEVGVYQGHLFKRLAVAAADTCRTAHAFDTFTGMAEPGPLDDAEGYAKGAMSPGGVEAFAAGLPITHSWRLWPGEIPAGFARYDADPLTEPLAFAYVDVDHFTPTLVAAVWCWNNLVPGGVLGFDDWFPDRRGQAAGAIGWFLACVEPADRWETDNRQLFLVR